MLHVPQSMEYRTQTPSSGFFGSSQRRDLMAVLVVDPAGARDVVDEMALFCLIVYLA